MDDMLATGLEVGAYPALVTDAIAAVLDDPTSPSRVLVGEDAVAAVSGWQRAHANAWIAEHANRAGALTQDIPQHLPAGRLSPLGAFDEGWEAMCQQRLEAAQSRSGDEPRRHLPC